jgi:UDP-2,3-diacylglucosamine pyrophosphatase LpxH
MKRSIEILVLSDIHLGTFGCQSKALLKYLKSIDPKTIILNGDIIDIWQFSKRYFPKSHMKIVKYFLNLIQDGKTIYYLTGNHDEMLRKFNGFELKNFKILNKKVINLNGHKAWFFHGDVFDVSMKYSKWLAKLGGVGYDLLIVINSVLNFMLIKMGRQKYSLSKKVKNGVKGAIKFINKFEETIVEIASERGYKYVVCGHIHQPNIKTIISKGNEVVYLNSGDWIENLTALEYNNGRWNLYHHDQNDSDDIDNDITEKNYKEINYELLNEFQINEI